MKLKQTPINIEGIDECVYAGFWIRVWAYFLDALFMLPVLFLILYLNGLGLNVYFYTLLPSTLLLLWNNVYLPQKNGATPGKVMAGITIMCIDGYNNGWHAYPFADLGTQAGIFAIGTAIPVAGWALGAAYFAADYYTQNEYGEGLYEHLNPN